MAKTPSDKPRELGNLTTSDAIGHNSEATGEKQRKLPEHLFKPGQSGNPQGRPKGARNKLTEDFVKALADDFGQHGRAAITTVREEDPGKYLDIVAKLVPKDIDVNVTGMDAFVKMWELTASGAFKAMAEDIADDVSRAGERPN